MSSKKRTNVTNKTIPLTPQSPSEKAKMVSGKCQNPADDASQSSSSASTYASPSASPAKKMLNYYSPAMSSSSPSTGEVNGKFLTSALIYFHQYKTPLF